MSIHKSELKPYIRERQWLLKPIGVLLVVGAPLFLPCLVVVTLINEGVLSDYWADIKACFGEVES